MSDDTFDDLSDPEVTEGYSSVTVDFPKFTSWSVTQIYNYGEQLVDYNTIDELSHSITKARGALFLLTDKINEYERKEKLAKTTYERAFRRAYLGSTEKTESTKKIRAELKCEELENEWLILEQLKNELVRTSYSMRLELQTLQTIGNNLRLQLKG